MRLIAEVLVHAVGGTALLGAAGLGLLRDEHHRHGHHEAGHQHRKWHATRLPHLHATTG